MSVDEENEKWFMRLKPSSEPAIRLFCLPYAGSGPTIFRLWPDEIDNRIDVWSVRYPGRETRIRERPMNRLEPLADGIAAAIAPNLTLPFALFGHSLGGILAFEVTRRLIEQGHTPAHLFVSAHRAPECERHHVNVHTAPEAAFLDRLRGLDGTPDLFFENEGLRQLMMPTLRADFAIWETYQYRGGPLIDVPLTVFGATRDSEATRSDMMAWKRYGTGRFRTKMFPGGHFFWNDDLTIVTREIEKDLAPFL